MAKYNGYWSDPELKFFYPILVAKFGSHDKSVKPHSADGDANFTYTFADTFRKDVNVKFKKNANQLVVYFKDGARASLVAPVSWGKIKIPVSEYPDEEAVEAQLRFWLSRYKLDEITLNGDEWEVYVLDVVPNGQTPKIFSGLSVDLPPQMTTTFVPFAGIKSKRASSPLRARLIRLAHENPGLRKSLLPLLRTAADPSYQDYVERKKKDGETPLDKKEWEVKVLNKGKGEPEGGKADEATIKKSQTALRDLYKPLEAAEESFESALRDAGLEDHEVKAAVKEMKAEAKKIRENGQDVWFDAADGKDVSGALDGIKKEVDALLSGALSEDKIKARIQGMKDKKKKDSDDVTESLKKRREENAPKVKALPSKVKKMFSGDEDIEEVFDAMPEKMFDKNEGRSAPHTKKAIEALKGKLSAGEASALRAKAEKVYYEVLDEMKVVDPGDESKDGNAAYAALHKAQNTWRVFSQLEQEAEDDPDSFKGGKGGKKASDLRSELIRLAHAEPNLRAAIIPLLRSAAGTYQDYVERKKKKNETPLGKDAWEARTKGKGKGKQEGGGEKGEEKSKPESKEEYHKRFVEENAAGRKAFPSKMKDLYGGGGTLKEIFDGAPGEFSSKNEAEREKHVTETVKSLKSKLSVGEARKLAQESEAAFDQALKAFGSSFMHGESTEEGVEAEKQFSKAQNTLSIFRELGRMTKSNPKSFKGGGEGGKKASDLRSSLIRLAHENPALRKKLIPLITSGE